VLLVVSPIFGSESRSLAKLRLRVSKGNMVAPTIVPKGSPVSGFEPQYSFIDETPVGQEKIGESIQGLNKNVASSEAKVENSQEKRIAVNLEALKAGAEKVSEGAAVATEASAKVEETKVDLKVQEAKEEEQKLSAALDAVRAAEARLEAETQTAKAGDVPSAAPEAAAPAPAEAEAAAVQNQVASESAAADSAVAEEEAKVDAAEQQVSQQEAAVTQAVQDEEAVKDKLSELENKVDTEATEEPSAEAAAAPGGFTQPAEVFVGPKNIPAQNTRSVMVMGDHEQNKAKYDAVPTDPNLLTDPQELKAIHKGVSKTGEEIQNIHETVETISKEPLVPASDGSIMAEEQFPMETDEDADSDE
jgi:hypothetical protein